MRNLCLLVAAGLALLAGRAGAQSPGAPELLLTQMPALPVVPTLPPGGVPTAARVSPPAAPARAAAEPGTAARASIAPHMIGDLVLRGYALRVQRFVVRTATGPAQPPRPNQPPMPPGPPTQTVITRTTREPVVSGGAFKIAENESPRPVDRIFATYNYYDKVNTFGGRDFDVHREVFGFEKTFLDGDASFGVRVPVLQRSGADGANFIDGFGDLSLIFKFAAVNDAATGDVLSGGLVLTVPTGRDVRLVDGGRLNSTFFQPWVGGIANAGRVYFQGFSSIVIPTESRDVTFLSNDLGVGYRLYQADGDALVTLVAPTIEGHLFTPLSNRGDADILRAWDSFTLTAGVHVGLANRAFLTLGVGTPLVGPRPYDFEAVVQFNLRF